MARHIIDRNNVRVIGHGTRPMVLAHGFGTDQRAWRLITPALEAEYRLVLFDYVGAGQSDLSAYSARRYESLEGYASDLLEVCAALGLHDAIFVGHSVSGMVGVLAANREPERFSHLIMIGPSPRYLNDGEHYTGGFEREDIDGMLGAMEQNYSGWAAFLAPQVMRNPERPWLTFELEESFRATDPVIARQFAQTLFYADHRADLAKVTVPSLVMQCADDVVAPRSVGEYLRDNLPNATLHHLSATGHYPQLSAPDETVHAIRSYLQARAA